MIVGNFDIYIEQGSTWQLNFEVVQDNNIPIDLTGYTGICQIRKTANAQEALAVPIISIIDPVQGKVQAKLTANQTKLIPTTGSDFSDYNKYLYELQLLDADGNTAFRLYGYAYVSAGVIK